MTSAQQTAFGVYVHWPFCLSKCPYCDFNSHVRHAPIDEARFARAFAREIETTAARDAGARRLLDLPRRRHAVADAAANRRRHSRRHRQALARRAAMSRSRSKPTRPASRPTRFRGYRAAGVNRVSLGVQALDDASLKALGRLHSAREALDAVAIARQAFDRYSFDLIYARPGQTPQDVGERTEAGDRGSRRTSVALSAHHRGRHAVLRPACGGQAADAGRGDRARALRRHAGCLQRGRPAGLRDLQPRAAGRGVPPQPRLLARRGIRRHRPRRAWPARHRRHPSRHRDGKASRDVADARRVDSGMASSPTTASTAKSAPTNSC